MRVYDCKSDIDPDASMNKITNQPGLNLEMPVSEITLNELGRNESKSLVKVHRTSFESCMASIKNLSCDSNEFKAAFDVNQPEDFSTIHKIFRINSECLKAFTDVQ